MPIDGSTPVLDTAVPDDTAVTTPPIDARQCFGVGLLKLCLSAAPTGDKTLSTAINTDTGPCTQVIGQTGSPTMAPDLCVIASKTITVQGSVTVQGSRALVLIAAETIVVSGGATLDASSTAHTNPRRVGPGANLGVCTAPGAADNAGGGAGGGAGGSLATKGGDGGRGNLNAPGGPKNASQGGKAGATQAAPTLLRGGCNGGKGGDSQIINNVGNGAAGGKGGGAVYLIAGTSITVTGDVFASGAGGDATNNNAGGEQGGGGGGTGGMIGFDAPTVTINGRVVANGGAGGGGGGQDTGGKPGGDGTTTSWNMQATPGDAGMGGPIGIRLAPGAPGTAVGLSSNVDGPDADTGGGGGGGGLGIITVYGTLAGATTVSPAPTTHP